MFWGLIAGWGFLNFIYLKIVTEAFFNHGMSIIVALLISITFVMVISTKYTFKPFYINVPDTPPCVSLLEIIKKTVIPFILFSVAYMAVSRGIVFGFSQKLNREMTWSYNEGVELSAYFFIILFVPILLHYAITIFGMHNTSKVAKTNIPRTCGVFKYKDSKSFFEIQCEYGDISLERGKGVVAVVKDANIYDINDEFRRYYNLIKVASEDGGFEVYAPIPSGLRSDLKVGDMVIWVPWKFNENSLTRLTDKRSGWLGSIMAKIAPEMDMSETGQWIVLKEYS